MWKDSVTAALKMAEYRRLKRLQGRCDRCLQPATDGLYCDWHRNYMRIMKRLAARKRGLKLRGTIRTFGGNWKGDMTPLPGPCSTQLARIERWAKARQERKHRAHVEPIEPICEFYPYNTAHDSDMIAQVNAAVPSGLPEEVRADVCQDILAAIVTGEISVQALRESVKAYVKEGYHRYGWQWGHVSLDQPRAADDDRPSILLATDKTPLDELLEMEAIDGQRDSILRTRMRYKNRNLSEDIMLNNILENQNPRFRDMVAPDYFRKHKDDTSQVVGAVNFEKKS